MTIALLIDTSGSVKDKLDFEKATAAEFFKEILRPNKDLALIIQFDADVNLVQDFTQNQNDLLDALDSLKAGNSTALYDAVFLAAEEKLKKEVGRKVMVVITDGEDTSSRMRKEEAIQAAQRNDVLIYGIGVQGEEYGTNFGVLKKFAEETGGAFFFSPRKTCRDSGSLSRYWGRNPGAVQPCLQFDEQKKRRVLPFHRSSLQSERSPRSHTQRLLRAKVLIADS